MTTAPIHGDEIRQLPHSDEAELAVLGAIMLDQRCYAAVAQTLSHTDFYRAQHRKIFRAMGRVLDSDSNIDALTVADELERNDELERIGGRSALHKLSNRMPSAANVKNYVDIVAEKSRLRGLIQGLQGIVGDCYEGITSDAAIDRASAIVRRVADRSRRRDSSPKTVARKIVEYHEAVLAGEVERELSCGVGIIDKLTRWGLGKYHVVGAYSGHGKTTLCGTAVAGLAYHHDAVVSWWNCEIAQIFQALRIITPLFADDAGGRPAIREQWALHPDRVPQSHRDRFERQMVKALAWFAKSGLHIEPPGAIRIREVELTAQAMRLEYPDRPLVIY